MASLNKAKSSAAKKAALSKKAAPVEDAPVSSKKAASSKKASAKKAASARPPKPEWQAPADFKPAFFQFVFTTDDQGLMDPASLSGERIRGRWDNPDAKRYDLSTYDQSTLIGFAARMSAAIWGTNPARRIPGNTTYTVVLRVNKRSATGALAVRVIGVQHKVEGKKAKWFEDKADPTFRKFRRAARWLPAAFTDVQLPPSRRSKKEKTDEE